MNTKALLASTLLTALFAGTSAIAGDNDHFAVADNEATNVTTSETAVMKKVSYQSPTVETGYVFDSSNR